MAVTTDELLIKINIQGAEASASIGKLTNELDHLKKSQDANSKSSNGFMDSFAKLNLGIFAFVQNIKVGIDALKSFAQPFMDAEDAAKRLGFAMAEVGVKDTAQLSKQIQALGSEMQRLGIAEDDQITQLAAVQIAAGRTSKQIEIMVKAAAGISTIKPETSFIEAFNALAASFKGNGKALSLLAPEIAQMSKEAFMAGDGAQYMSEKFGSYAQKNLELFSGKTKAASLAFGDLEENLGGLINEFLGLPASVDRSTATFNALNAGVTSLRNSLARFDFKQIAIDIGLVTIAIALMNREILVSALDVMYVQFMKLLPIIISSGAAILSFAATAVSLVAIGLAVEVIIRNWETLYEIIKDAGQIGFAYFIKGINAAAIKLIELKSAVADVFSGLVPGYDEMKKKNDETIKALQNSSATLGQEIDQNLADIQTRTANLDLGNLGAIADTLASTFSSTGDGFKEMQRQGAATGKALGPLLTEEATKALDQLKTLLESTAKDAATAGLEGVAKINAEAAVANAKIVELTKTIKEGTAGHIIRPEDLAMINQLKAATDKAFDAKKVEAFKKSQEELDKTTLDMQKAYNDANDLTSDKIQHQLEYELEIIKAKEKQLKLQGLLTPQAQKSLDDQKGIATKTAETAQKKAPTLEFEGMVKAGQDMIGGITKSFTAGTAGMVAGFLVAAKMVVDAIGAALDFIPQLIDGVASIFNKITNLPVVIFDAIQGLFDSIVGLVQNLIPNILKTILGSITQLKGFILGLFHAIIDLIKKLPEMIKNFAKELPALIQDLIQSVIEALPDLIMALFDYSVIGKVVIRLVEMIAWTLPVAILKGVLKAFEQIWKRIWAAIQGKKFGEHIAKEFDKVLKKFSGSTSKLFNVSDMTDAITNPKKELLRVAKQVEDSFKKAIKDLESAWKSVWDKLPPGVQNFLNLLFNPVAWYELGVKIFNGLTDLWGNIWSSIPSGLQDFLNLCFNPVTWYELGVKLFNGISDLWGNLWSSMPPGLQDFLNLCFNPETWYQLGVKIFNGLSDLWGNLWHSMPSGLQDFLNVCFNPMKWVEMAQAFLKTLGTLGIGGGGASGLGGSGNDISKQIVAAVATGGLSTIAAAAKKIFKFSEGGQVPLYASSGMFVPQGTDTVPAMLTPGEFIMSRPAVNAIGLENLKAMNAGRFNMGGGQTSNISNHFEINVDAKTTMDESYIRGKLIPTLQEELKRASLDGKFVISSRGIR